MTYFYFAHGVRIECRASEPRPYRAFIRDPNGRGWVLAPSPNPWGWASTLSEALENAK